MVFHASFTLIFTHPPPRVQNLISGRILFPARCKSTSIWGFVYQVDFLCLLDLEIHNPCLAAKSKKHNCTTKHPAKKNVFTHPFGRSRWFNAVSCSFHVPVWLFHIVSCCFTLISHSFHAVSWTPPSKPKLDHRVTFYFPPEPSVFS
jgi:hypothetical protein